MSLARNISLAISARRNRFADEVLARGLYRKYRHATMISPEDFRANVKTAKWILSNPAMQGAAVIECGTWRGGMSAALCEIGGPDRDYHFFDSFEGLPPATDLDGPRAKAYQAEKTDPHYFNNCTASLQEFEQTIALTGLADRRIIQIYKGWFEDTLRDFKSPPIGLLRLDGDFYDSTMTCLKALWPHLLSGAGVLLDDYYAWEGCTRAVHDFLSSVKATERIQQKSGQLALIIKN